MNANIILQDRFLEAFFAGLLGPSFYLTGGTALARYYFSHRESLDLDLFTNQQDQDFSQVNQVLLGIFNNLSLQITSQVITDTFIQYLVYDREQRTLKIDLVKDVLAHFGELVIMRSVRVDSLENIGSNKILAVFGRTDAKDFIDLYWILHRTDLKFDNLYRQALEKDSGLSELYMAYALQNVTRISIFPPMLVPLPWDEIKAFYQSLAQDILMRIKPE